MPLNMKILTTLPSEKNGSVDVTFAREITHQKHLAQSRRSTRSAVDIFNTLCVFTKEPIREQEIKLECMNIFYSMDHQKNCDTLNRATHTIWLSRINKMLGVDKETRNTDDSNAAGKGGSLNPNCLTHILPPPHSKSALHRLVKWTDRKDSRFWACYNSVFFCVCKIMMLRQIKPGGGAEWPLC